jgi:hypothetical protein
MKYLLATAMLTLAMIPMGAETASAHGCHRDAQYGPRGLHYHAGPDCDRIAGRRPDYRERGRDFDDRRDYRGDYRSERRGRRCVEKCKYLGPIKQCRTECV